jgi:dolichol-phosphate mannosyltransferase
MYLSDERRRSPVMKTIVLVPTFNEAGNLAPLTQSIFASLPETDILVIDDGSTDGTIEVARKLMEENRSRFFVLFRKKKEGLGRAYVAGFRWVLERDYDFVFHMDADFSHPPRYLPKLLEKAQRDDVVIGSRYTEGGKDERTQWSRKLLSKAGNFYARSLLSLNVADMTSGFKCFRRKVLEQLDLGAIESNGFLFLVEVNYRVSQAGKKIGEVPIVFEERKAGSSKMSFEIMREGVWKVLKMRVRH